MSGRDRWGRMGDRRMLFPLALAVVLLLVFTGAVAVAGPSGAARGHMAPADPAFAKAKAASLPATTPDGKSLGYVAGPQDLSFATSTQTPGLRLATFPVSYDLRSTGRLTSVKDQGVYGACWAFATLGSLESFLMTGQNLDFSEDNIALTHGFDTSGDIYDRGGTFLMSTAYLARWSGPVYESDDAYGDYSTPSGLVARKHVRNVDWLPARTSPTDNNAIKNALTLTGAVAVGMRFDGSSLGSQYYDATTHAYFFDMPYNEWDTSTYANHAVLVVGWDDSYAASNFATTPAGPGAFIVRNSWGTSWGDNGYFYVSYYDTIFGTTSVSAAFDSAAATTDYAQVYQYDPLGYVEGWGSGTTGQAWWGANVFTASSAAPLAAVGFYALAPNSAYEVWAGPNLASLTKRTAGTMTYMGYHSVILPSTMALTAGQRFAVAIKVTSPGMGYPIAIEYPWTDYSASATASAGQSYESSDGLAWTDITTEATALADPGLTETNVCIKAYTTNAAPTVTAVSPVYGSSTGGTSVTITGTKLLGATAVKFGGTAATNVTVVSATSITCKAPAHGGGRVDVTVTTPYGTSSTSGTGNDFTYVVRNEQSSKLITYGGSWATASSTSYSGGSQNKTTGGWANLKFTGTGVKILSTKGPAYGTMKIYIDGSLQGTFDLYNPTGVYKQSILTKTGLTNAGHTVRIESTGLKNALSTGTTVNLDAVDTWGVLAQASAVTRYEQSHSYLGYAGNYWSTQSSTSYSGTSMKTTTSTGSVTAKFTGSAFAIICTKGTAFGKLKVTLDGTLLGYFDEYLSASAYRQTLMMKTGLSNVTHTLKLEYSGQKNGNASSAKVNVDAIDVQGSLISAVAPAVFFSDGFESGLGKWQRESSPTWAVTGYRHGGSSGAYSIYCVGSSVSAPGPYPDDVTARIFTPTSIDLSSTTTAFLEFDMWLDSEFNYDWLSYLVSTDGVNYYGDGWWGYSNGWVHQTIDLRSVPNGSGGTRNVTGRPIWIMFRFVSDFMNFDYYEGGYVDNVRIGKTALVPPTSASLAGSSLMRSGPVKVTLAGR